MTVSNVDGKNGRPDSMPPGLFHRHRVNRFTHVGLFCSFPDICPRTIHSVMGEREDVYFVIKQYNVL